MMLSRQSTTVPKTSNVSALIRAESNMAIGPYRGRGPDGFAGVAGLSLSCTTRSLSRRTSSS